MRKHVPGLVGGEPADLILKTVRSFPLSLDYSGRIVLHETATGAAAESFQRAYERVELDVITREDRCPRRASHRTLDATQYRWVILTALMVEARISANEMEQPDALWLIKPGTSPLHSGERLVMGP
jgi:hypothetical protein